MSKRVVFMGTPDFAVPSLHALINDGWDVVAVVTQPDRPKGRGRRLTPPPVKVAAQERGVPVILQPEKLRTREAFQAIEALAPDFLVVVAYGKILGPRFLALPSIAPLNVHASLLPRYRGAAPIHWSVVRGEEETGVAIMQMERGLDTGPVFAMESIPIAPNDTAGSLHDRLAELGARLLVHTARRIVAEGLEPVSQDDAGATFAPILAKADGALRFDEPAARVAARARGMAPWPGAFCRFRGKLLKVHGAIAVSEEPAGVAAGTLLGVQDARLLVACEPGVIAIEALQMEGKGRQPATDFERGYRLEAGERLTPDPRVTERRD